MARKASNSVVSSVQTRGKANGALQPPRYSARTALHSHPGIHALPNASTVAQKGIEMEQRPAMIPFLKSSTLLTCPAAQTFIQAQCPWEEDPSQASCSHHWESLC